MKKLIMTILSVMCLSEMAFANKLKAKNDETKKDINWCASKADLACMENTLWGEARGEGYDGMLWVGKTIATRLARGTYKKSVCGIVKGAAYAQKTAVDRKQEHQAFLNMKKAAKLACSMGDMGVTHFHSYKTMHSKSAPWAKHMTPIFKKKTFGHWFFNAPAGTKASFSDKVQVETDEVNSEMIQEPYYPAPGLDDSEPIIQI